MKQIRYEASRDSLGYGPNWDIRVDLHKDKWNILYQSMHNYFPKSCNIDDYRKCNILKPNTVYIAKIMRIVYFLPGMFKRGSEPAHHFFTAKTMASPGGLDPPTIV